MKVKKSSNSNRREERQSTKEHSITTWQRTIALLVFTEFLRYEAQNEQTIARRKVSFKPT
jgi:hypothetical protein